jgi:FkbM family methyltransferase
MARPIARVLRRLLPHRRVVREVHGVRLAMPRLHRLPDFVEEFPGYGLNLIDVARVIDATEDQPWSMVDVGANIGDSALQVRNVTACDVLCVEGDPYWLPFLRENTAGDARISIADVLVTAEASEGLAPVRALGTTRLEATKSGQGLAAISVADLAVTFPPASPVRLIKSDTDGYDARLVPALLDAWSDSVPSVFFEYDPALTAKAGEPAPLRVWRELLDRGYDDYFVWDNFGVLLGHFDPRSIDAQLDTLVRDVEAHRYHYWDVLAVHRSDDGVSRALHEAFDDD